MGSSGAKLANSYGNNSYGPASPSDHNQYAGVVTYEQDRPT